MNLWAAPLLQMLIVLGDLLCVFPAVLFEVALNKTSTQSSTAGSKVAGNAVDGDFNTVSDYCSHTESETDPWWQVDLGATFMVHSIKIWNRINFGNRLTDFTVGVSRDNTSQGTVCTIHHGSIPDNGVKLIPCDQVIEGRFLKISKPSVYLALCEVQVFATRTRTVFERQPKKVTDGDLISQESLADVPSCAEVCQSNMSCLAFAHNRVTGTCRLYRSGETSDTEDEEWSLYLAL